MVAESMGVPGAEGMAGGGEAVAVNRSMTSAGEEEKNASKSIEWEVGVWIWRWVTPRSWGSMRRSVNTGGWFGLARK